MQRLTPPDTLQSLLSALPLEYAPAIAFALSVAVACAIAGATYRGGMR